jgi:hypothetical protein
MAQKVTSSKASTHTVGSVPASHHTWGKKSSDRSHSHTTHTATQVSSHPTTTPRKPSVQSTNTCTAGQGTARHSTASLGHNRHAAKQQQQCHPDTLHIQHRPAAAATHTCCFTAGRVPCRGQKSGGCVVQGHRLRPHPPTPTLRRTLCTPSQAIGTQTQGKHTHARLLVSKSHNRRAWCCTRHHLPCTVRSLAAAQDAKTLACNALPAATGYKLHAGFGTAATRGSPTYDCRVWGGLYNIN